MNLAHTLATRKIHGGWLTLEILHTKFKVLRSQTGVIVAGNDLKTSILELAMSPTPLHIINDASITKAGLVKGRKEDSVATLLLLDVMFTSSCGKQAI